MQTHRCFIAIDIPDQAKKVLADVQKKLKVWPARVKWVEEQNFHLTLKFLGDVSVEKIEQIESVLLDICPRYKKGLINLNGFGAFPNTSNPRVIWAGIQDVNRGLVKIWTDLEKSLEKLGFPKEARRFSPHLTLGRVKEPADGLASAIQSLQHLGISVPVREIKLMNSRLSRNGPEYSCINSFFLQEH